MSLFSTISSLAGCYITPDFLLPHQNAEIVKELADDEVTRETQLPQQHALVLRHYIRR